MAQREPEKRRLRGNLIHVYKELAGECGVAMKREPGSLQLYSMKGHEPIGTY